MKIAIIIGSLRNESLNLLLGEEAAVILSESAQSEIIVPDLPLFNQDLEEKGSEPLSAEVRNYRQQVREADGVLVCAPEYDRLPSAIILNACHWLSRQPDRPLDGKPVMLSGVSSGKGATQNARPTLQIALERIGGEICPQEIFVPDGEELLTDEKRKEALQQELEEKLPYLLDMID